MRVRIVCYEDIDRWIVGKFAIKMNECLVNMDIDSDIEKEPDPSADINHHIIYAKYKGRGSNNDTLMITHIDNSSKLQKLKKQLEIAILGICFSRESLDQLAGMGIPRSKLAYINPAHDGVMVPKPKVIGITCRVQKDGRKRENFLSKLASHIDPRFFCFKIMGDGWDHQVDALRKKNFKVEYIHSFDYAKYVELLPSLDYYLYMGQDEGQMGFVDALAAGVETIVTAQGFHLDVEDGITYPFNTYDELLRIFKSLQEKRVKLIKSVEDWTWSNYTVKHLEIWEYLLSKNKDTHIPPDKKYRDGVYSLYPFDNAPIKQPSDESLKASLYLNTYRHRMASTVSRIRSLFKRVITKTYRSVL